MSEPLDALHAEVGRARVAIDTTVERFRLRLQAAWAGVADPALDEHLTAIAWVFDDPGRHLLLVEHRLHGWSCPGGHLDVGEHPRHTAERELFEETGLRAGAAPIPLSISTALGCGRAADRAVRHWTLGYHFVVALDAPLHAEAGQAVRWFDCDALPTRRAPDIDRVLAALAGR